MSGAPSPESVATPKPKRSGWRRVFAGALLLCVGVLIGARLWLPYWLAETLTHEISLALGREVQIGGVDLSLLSGVASLHDATIGAALGSKSDADPRLTLKRVDFSLNLFGLLRREVHLRRVAFDGLTLLRERDAAGELEPLVLATPEPEPESESADPAWPVLLDGLQLDNVALRIVRHGETARREVEFSLEALALSKLAVREGRISVGDLVIRGPALSVRRAPAAPSKGTEPPPLPQNLDDGAGNEPPRSEPVPPSEAEAASDAIAGGASSPLSHRIEALGVEDAEFVVLWDDGVPLAASLDFKARDISTAPGESFPVTLELEVEDGALAIDGQASLTPFSFEGDVRWSNLAIPRLLEAAGASFDGKLEAGKTEGDLALKLHLGGEGATPEVSWQGSARIDGLGLEAGDTSIAAESIEVDFEQVRVSLTPGGPPPNVHLRRVRLNSPVASITRQPPTGGAPIEADPPADSQTPGPQILVDALLIENGKLDFRDRSLQEPFRTRWRAIQVSGEQLRWPEQDANKLQLQATGPGGARLRIDSTLAAGVGRVKSNVEGLSLAAFDPYAKAFSGLQIQEGKLSLASDVRLGASTKTQSTLAFHQLKLSEREDGWFKNTFGVPLDVALALLRDLNGDITLPIDADFGADEAKVGMLPIVAATLKHAIVGALTSPLKLLGGIADVAGDVLGSDDATVAATPGREEVPPAATAQLAALAEMLANKPGLAVLLKGGADAEDDPTLARERVLELARSGEALPGEAELGFLERRRVRRALAGILPTAEPSGPDAESEAALASMAGNIEVTEQQRAALSQARAKRLRQQLIDEHDVLPEAVMIDEAVTKKAGVAFEVISRPLEEDPS